MEKPKYQFGDIVWVMYNNEPVRGVYLGMGSGGIYFFPEGASPSCPYNFSPAQIRWQKEEATVANSKQELLDSFKD